MRVTEGVKVSQPQGEALRVELGANYVAEHEFGIATICEALQVSEQGEVQAFPQELFYVKELRNGFGLLTFHGHRFAKGEDKKQLRHFVEHVRYDTRFDSGQSYAAWDQQSFGVYAPWPVIQQLYQGFKQLKIDIGFLPRACRDNSLVFIVNP